MVTIECKTNATKGLCGIYQDLIDLIGMEDVVKIYSNYKGLQVTFPTKLFSREYVKECVKAEYDGKNVKALAKSYGYSERWIRKTLHECKQSEKGDE